MRLTKWNDDNTIVGLKESPKKKKSKKITIIFTLHFLARNKRKSLKKKSARNLQLNNLEILWSGTAKKSEGREVKMRRGRKIAKAGQVKKLTSKVGPEPKCG